MSVLVYQLLHVVSAFLFVATVFTAFASSAGSSHKRIHMSMGILALVVIVAGFGLTAKLDYGFPGWVIAKVLCWFGLAGTAGIALRDRGKAGWMRLIAIALVALAIYAGYAKPF